MKIVIDKLISQHQRVRDSLAKEVLAKPKGKLYVREIGDRVYFAEYADGRVKGITEDAREVCALARKEYAEFLLCKEKMYCKVLEKLSAELGRIEKEFNGGRFEEWLWRLECRGIDTGRVVFDEEKYAWMTELYESNPYKPEHLRYTAKCGIKVRSKSERMIADRLTERGILFRYEMRIDTESGVMYPDFVIRKENGELVVWEHFGLMDKNDYLLDAMKKIVKYRSAGFVQHKNLICTWESDLESLEMIDEIIDRFILNM